MTSSFEPSGLTSRSARSPEPAGVPLRWEWEDLARAKTDTAADLEALREARHAEELELTFQHGYREGQMATRADMNRHLRTAMAAAGAATRALGEKSAAWEAAVRDDLAALAVVIARQIVAREIATTPETVAELVDRAVALFPTEHALRVRLNPDDFHALTSGVGDDAGDLPHGRAVRWIPDAEIAPGGCLVEGPSGIVDGRVDAALERIYRTLTHAL